MVELGKAKVLDKPPLVASVVREGDSSVLAKNHPPRVVRIDPKLVDIPMDDPTRDHGAPRTTLVFADLHRRMQRVDPVFVQRVHPDICVVERAWNDAWIVIDRRPASSSIIRPYEFGAGSLHDRINDVRIRGGHRHSDATQFPGRHPIGFGESPPGITTVVRDVEARSHAAGRQEPWVTTELPHCRENFVRVHRVHDHIGHTSAFILPQHLLPALAAVTSPVDATFLTVRPGRAEHSHVNHLWVSRVCQHAVDSLRVSEAHVPPCVPAIYRLEETPSDAGAVSRITLSRPDPHDVRIWLKNRNMADPEGGLFVEHGIPGESAIRRFEYPTRCGAYVDHAAIGEDNFHVGHAPAHARRANLTSLHCSEWRLVILSRGGRSGSACGDQRRGAEEPHLVLLS